MKLCIYFINLLTLLQSVNVVNSVNLDSNQCAVLNAQYWETIKRFYGSPSTLFVIFIHPFKPSASCFELSSNLLKDLPKKLNCSVTYQVIDTECGCVKLSSNRLKFLNILKRETDSAVLIIAENIFSLDKILFVLPQYLADFKRRKIIIAITNTSNIHFNGLASDLLTKFWEEIRIANVILITPCTNDQMIIRTYFPFEPTSSASWGMCKNLPVSNATFFDIGLKRKFTNFHGFPMKISFFWRYPTSMRLNELSNPSQTSYIMADIWRAGNFSGVDGLMLASLVKKFNFTPVLIKPSGADFGYKTRNGQFLGTIGEVLSGRTYGSFIGHFMNDYGSDEIEYIFPYFFDKLCIVSPKAPRIPEWMAIFQCYDITVWFSLLVMNSLCGWIWFMLKRTHARDPIGRRKQHKRVNCTKSVGAVFIDMWLIMLSGPLKRLPSHKAERLFLTTCLFSNLIFIGTFQSSLKTSFTTVTHFKDIRTLRQLDDSGLPIGTSSGSLFKVFGSMENVFGWKNESNSVIKSLQHKYMLINSTKPALELVINNKNVCCIERFTDVKVILTYKYRMNDGSSPLHIIEECLRSFYLAYIVKKGSALQPAISYHVQRLFEGGFITFWYNQIEYAITTHRRYSRLLSRSNQQSVSLSLIDLQVAFFIWFIGLCAASILFLIEIVAHKRKGRMPFTFGIFNYIQHKLQIQH